MYSVAQAPPLSPAPSALLTHSVVYQKNVTWGIMMKEESRYPSLPGLADNLHEKTMENWQCLQSSFPLMGILVCTAFRSPEGRQQDSGPALWGSASLIRQTEARSST